MVVKELNDRYTFEEGQEELLGMLTRGKRIADDQAVEVLAIKPEIELSREGLMKAVEENQQIAERMIPQLLLMAEVGNLENGQYYIVSEGTDLPTLADIIKTRKNIDPADVMAVGYQLAYVLHQLRTMEILHLNLNDQNIHVSIENGNTKIRIKRTGFRHFIPEYSSSNTKQVFWGAPEVMASEICSSKGPSDSSDQYSLGIILYEMITGKPPFMSKSPKTTIKRQVYEKPLPIHLVRPSFKNVKEAEKVLSKLLHKDPTQRYQDLTEVMEIMAELASGVGASIELEQGRPDALPIEVRLSKEEATVQKSKETVVEDSKEEAPVRETMMFTGMVDELEDAIKAKVEQEGAPTKEELEKATTKEIKAESEKNEDKPKPEPQHKETIAIVREDLMPKEAKKEEKPAHSGTQTGDEWFVSDSSELAPRDVFGEQKESKLFWIIISVVIVLAGIAVALFVGSGKKEMPVEKPEPINHEQIKHVNTTPKAVPVKPKAVVPPVQKDAGMAKPVKKEPAAIVHYPAKDIKNAGKAAPDAVTKKTVKVAPTVPAGVPIEVKKPAKKKPVKKVVVRKARLRVKKTVSKKKTPRKITKKTRRKKTRSSSLIPKGMTPKQASIYYFKKGRAAEKSGNLKKALRNYHKVLNIEPTNRLVPHLIKRIQAKIK